MSQVIKKHRWQLAGIALPAFFLFLLWAVGVSVYPGWLRPLYGTVGTSCDASNPAVACDICVGESCEFTSFGPNCGGQVCPGFFCQAANGSFATPSPEPVCPAGQPGDGDPLCFRNCVEVGTGGAFECQPDDTFCEEISGGTTTNECRTAVCLASPDPNTNPSGCDYASDHGAAAECVLCATPAPTGTPSTCGNGVCEPILAGETATNCSIDCRVPGFTGPILAEGDATLNDACQDPPAAITFDGPPFNEPDSGSCEDGDVCTDNVCNVTSGDCDVTPTAASGDISDLCCPRSATPPPPGQTCANIAGTLCDVDCYVATECTLPTPTPTPTPPFVTPTPPPFNAFIEGSGCSLSALAGSSSALAWLAGFGLLAAFGIRRRD